MNPIKSNQKPNPNAMTLDGLMVDRLTVNYEGTPSYDICFQKDFTSLKEELLRLQLQDRKIMIISDTTVSKLYLREVMDLVSTLADRVDSFVFPAGEVSKTLDTVNECYGKLIEGGFDRKDILIALGGGVVGDLTGYVAATYLRGIRFIQIPTTLLSMVDSSIGGKTGVDYKAYKNMVGAFHQPKLVFINLATLISLSEREFNSGMGEIIKHGLIKDHAYYIWIREHRKDILRKEFNILKALIYRSCEIKKAVVEEDPKEQGDRALLNFGHTIGHAVEKLKDFHLLHGECVSIGMAAAGYLSYHKGLINKEELDNLLITISDFFLPVNVEGLDSETIYEVTRLDKKMDSNQIRFVLLRALGDSYVDSSITREEMLDAIQYISI